jgi:hypothetical protein
MAQVLTPKRSDETVRYFVDWTEQLTLTLDTISDYTLTVDTGTVTLSDETYDDFMVSFLAAGGADGVTQEITCEIVTTNGQTLIRALSLVIDDNAIAIVPQTSTKRQVIDQVFQEIGQAGYEFDTTAEEYASALTRLDMLMAQWRGPGTGLRIPYNAPTVIGDSDLADESGIPDYAMNGVVTSLALRIMPVIGKTMSPEGRIAYSQSMNAIRAACTVIPERILQRTTPRGAGNKPGSTWAPFGWGNNGSGQ